MYLLAWLNKDFGSFKSIGMRFHHVVLNQDSFKKEKKKKKAIFGLTKFNMETMEWKKKRVTWKKYKWI